MKTIKDAIHSQVSAGVEALRNLLEQRFGDGTIYLYSEAQRPVLEQAQWYGYVSMEGQITPVGRSFLVRFEEFGESRHIDVEPAPFEKSWNSCFK